MKVKSKCCGKPITIPLDYPEWGSQPHCTKCERECDVVRKELRWYQYGGNKTWNIWGTIGFVGFLYLVANVQLFPPLEFIKYIPWVGGFFWVCHNLLCFALLVGWILWGVELGSADHHLGYKEILSGLREE